MLAKLFCAMMAVETQCNDLAINTDENAHGIIQTRQLALDEVNKKYGTTYKLEDMKKRYMQVHVFLMYAKIHGENPFDVDEKTAERIARKWNGGPKGMEKESTKEYWKKVQVEMEKQDALSKVRKGS